MPDQPIQLPADRLLLECGKLVDLKGGGHQILHLRFLFLHDSDGNHERGDRKKLPPQYAIEFGLSFVDVLFLSYFAFFGLRLLGTEHEASLLYILA